MKKIYPFFFLPLLFLFSSCFRQEQKAPSSVVLSTSVIPVSDVTMYQIFVHNFTKEGTLNAVIPRLNDIKALGMNTIWLMPIQPIGKINHKGTYGSPYAISDYYAINPDIGNKSDFKNLVDSIHAKGMYVIIDEVANHTAWDETWVKDHPDWYTHDSTGKIIPPKGTDWNDVADLNYDNPDLRKEMIRSMQYWIDSFNIDGYRCDAAGMVPDDFWKTCIDSLRKIRPIIMLAESDASSMYANGFDMTYGWKMYHYLIHVWNGDSAIASIDRLLKYEATTYPEKYHPIRFITDHDENSWDNVPQVKFISNDGAKAAFITMMTLPGVPFIYQGQEVAFPTRINLFEKYTIDWSANPDLQKWYASVMAVYNNSDVLKKGSVALLSPGNKDVLVYTRTLNGNQLITVVNTHNKVVSEKAPDAMKGKSYHDLLTNTDISIGDKISLQPFQTMILKAK